MTNVFCFREHGRTGQGASMSNYVQFDTLPESEAYAAENAAYIESLLVEVRQMEGVVQAERWLCKNCPSFIAGLNEHDEIIVSLPLKK